MRENARIKGVRVDGFEGIAHAEADADTVSTEELSQLARECCGARCPVPLPDAAVSSHQQPHTAKLDDGVHAPEAHAAAEAEHSRMGHAGHDMSDPHIAAAMEADMRRRSGSASCSPCP